MPGTRTVTVLGRLEGFTNPESAEMPPDGRSIVVSNAAITTVPSFRNGNGLVYRTGDAYVSRVRLDSDGLRFEAERLLTGATGLLGTDILRVATATYPAGTVFAAAGGSPTTVDGSSVVPSAQARPQVLAYDPATGERLPAIPLWAGSEVARRYNALEQPNGLAVGVNGDLYVSDIPNTNPAGMLPPPVPAAIYRIPHEALDALAAGEPGAAESVQRIEMPGWVNGLTVSPVDGAVWAVSCSPQCPVGGGAYRLLPEHFAAGELPEPRFRDLGGAGGLLDGIGITRRGTLLASDPVTPRIHVLRPDGAHDLLMFEGAEKLGSPADINVCYPEVLGGEPALLIPDVSARGGTHSLTVVELTGL